MHRAFVFDFDGVIADSEALANTVLAEFVTELGAPTTLEDAYRNYMGKRFHEVVEAIQSAVGHELPQNFANEYQARTLDRFRTALKPVPGAIEFLVAHAAIPKCIASSSSPDRLALCIDVLNIQTHFDGRVFSSSLVARGKPHPDIFLHAASEIGVAPSDCIVIEDSPSGVVAGRAAGATVIGLLAGSHIGEGHAAKLLDAGADFIACSYAELEEIARPLLPPGLLPVC